ncbi:MAG: hypothetical protein QOK39_351 [Acidimicrobiaceae bacterium]|nr:hypothetical protein [Acidimicrobiaceae bacterium]
MRRSAAAIGLTVIGLWLILTFKSSPPSHAGPATPPAAIAPLAPTTTAAGAGTGVGAAPTTTAPGSSTTRTVTGSVFNNRYGPVQVAVVLNGTQIVDVRALQMPTDRARSADISSQAAPLLHDEVIAAQSAQIDTIGGATYTSGSYAQSLQSALDKARA